MKEFSGEDRDSRSASPVGSSNCVEVSEGEVETWEGLANPPCWCGAACVENMGRDRLLRGKIAMYVVEVFYRSGRDEEDHDDDEDHDRAYLFRGT